MPAPRALAIPLAALALLACGCSSSRVSLSGEPKYGKNAEDNYRAGLEEMKTESWTEAGKFFEHVRAKYPFSKYAALSELRLADMKYAQERFTEASEAYSTFVRMHPTHEQADYAAYRDAAALLSDGPSNFFAFPAGYERELKSLRDGVTRMEAFLAKWPSSTYRPQAEKSLAGARSLLVEHEWYVADFYLKRRRWAGAAGRYQALVTRYPGSKREVDALLGLADCWVKLDDRFQARQALQQVIAKHPDDPRRPQAEKLLDGLR